MAGPTDKRLAEDLVSLTASAFDARGRPLPLPKVKTAIPATSATAAKQHDPLQPISSGGIAWPLTEQSRVEQIRTLIADDGTEFDIADATEITFKDTAGTIGTMILKPPTT